MHGAWRPSNGFGWTLAMKAGKMGPDAEAVGTMGMKTTKLRHIGECQICEGDFKVRGGLMVHHGYKRPGWGYIVGDCPGVDEPPYEVSCDAIKRYRETVLESLDNANRRHDELEAGTAKITAYKRADYAWSKWGLDIPQRTKHDTKVIEPGDPDYDRLRKLAISKEIRAIEWLVHEVERATKRIDNWVKKPIRTIEEYEDEQKKLVVKAQRGLSHKQFKLMKAISNKTKATFDMADLAAVLSILGWTLEQGTAAVRLQHHGAERWIGLKDEGWHWSWGDKGADIEIYFNDADAESRAQRAYDRVLQHIEQAPTISPTGKKGPGADVQEEHVYVHLEEPKQRSFDREAFRVPLHAWLGVPQWTITTPGGEQVNVVSRVVDYLGGKIEGSHEMKSDRFWKFAYAHGLDKLAKQWIDAG
jgi:hypothetical protein